MAGKTLNNSTVPGKGSTDQVSDLERVGNPDDWKLVCKASSAAEGWMKSTKAMQLGNLGCLVQVTTQQGDNVAEAVCFVPGAKVIGGIAHGHQIVPM